MKRLHILTIVTCLGVFLGAKPVMAEASASGSSAHADTHLLVCLAQPLAGRALDGGYPLATGIPAVDALIGEAGISRIEHAVPVSSRKPGNPEVFRQLGLDRTYRMFVPSGSDIPDLAHRFAELPGVVYAEPDYVGEGGATVPDDTHFNLQYGLHQASDADMDAPEAWDLTLGSEDVIIAVLDTGSDSDHEDFADKLVAGYDFAYGDADPEDDHGHGSNVGSIAAAVSNNATGIAGACWNCKIMTLKVLDADNYGFYSWWTDAMVWAADNGADLINMSAGGTSPSTTLLNGVLYAWNAGVPHISITHNDNTGEIRYPGRYAQTITVGATNDQDDRAVPFCWGGGSNWGPQIDVVAPGDWIPGVNMGGGYSYWCGTSQAAPHVAGLGGLMMSVYPSIGREEMRHLLQSGAEDQVGLPAEDTAGFDQYHGWGRVNMDRTLLGTLASMTLRVEGEATTRPLLATANPLATSYDFIRGDVGSLAESSAGVSTGAVICLENDSPDGDTLGDEDTGSPAIGEAFFYLARFNSVAGAGQYGGSTLNRDRIPSSGDCAP
jgi:subtilisin family serine protease